MAEIESLEMMDCNYNESTDNDGSSCSYSCDKCGIEIKRKDNFKRHYLQVHGIGLTDFKNFEKSLDKPCCSRSVDDFIDDDDMALNIIGQAIVGNDDSAHSSETDSQGESYDFYQDGMYHCDQCTSKIKRKDNFKRHYMKVHKLVYKDNQVDGNSKNRCIFPGCTEIFYHKSKMVEHLKEKHRIVVNTITKDFSSMEEFYDWKEIEESTNFVWFPKKDERKLPNNVTYSSFVCQCNGFKQDSKLKHSSLKRKMVKRNIICPARMLVKFNPAEASQIVRVKYIKSHNHEISCDDIKNKPIPSKMKTEITAKLLDNKSVEEVISELHQEAVNSPSSSAQKVFIEKHKIKYLQQKLNLPLKRPDKTAVSIEKRLKAITSEDYNPLLLYKLSTESENTDAKVDNSSFVIAIQTKEQNQLFQKYASGIVLLELASPTPFIPYYILTIKVLDEMEQAYNVGHLISTIKDEEVAVAFFTEIKSRCGEANIEINLVMTTLDVYAVEPFQSVFGRNIQFIYSKWHFHKLLFSKLLADCPNEEELRHQVYFTLVALIEQREIENFKVIASDFFHSYKTKCLSVVTFMAELYLSQPEKWALCFRNPEYHHCDSFMHINTTLQMVKASLGSVKDQLAMNTLLHALLDVDQLVYLKQMCRQKLAEVIPSSHVISLSIHDSDLSKVSDTQWLVSHNETYEVNWNSEGCPEEFCAIRCLDLLCFGLCQHMYSCNCRIEVFDICPHIHKVHSFEMGVSHCQKTDGGALLPSKNKKFQLYDQSQLNQKDFVGTIEENIAFIQHFVGNSGPSKEVLEEINETLENLKSICQTSRNIQKH